MPNKQNTVLHQDIMLLLGTLPFLQPAEIVWMYFVKYVWLDVYLTANWNFDKYTSRCFSASCKNAMYRTIKPIYLSIQGNYPINLLAGIR